MVVRRSDRPGVPVEVLPPGPPDYDGVITAQPRATSLRYGVSRAPREEDDDGEIDTSDPLGRW
jgi:hypothetical protein